MNINTADAKTLAKELVGVGPAKAEAIIKYRTEKGPFQSPEELKKVQGVGAATYEQNKASIKASDTRVNKGNKVTFTAKLTRPDSKDAIKGLPIALQKAPASGKNWNTVKSGKTNPSGVAKWTLKIKKASKYRTLGKAKKQKGGAGMVFDQVTSKSVTIRLT